MKRPGYRSAIAWVANNDGDGDPERLDLEHVSFLISTLLVADLFGKNPYDVGNAVVNYRIKNTEAPA